MPIRTSVPHTRRMDMTHNHLALGFAEGCPGCAQLEHDFARIRFHDSEARDLEDGATRLRAWYMIRRRTHQEFLMNPNKAASLISA